MVKISYFIEFQVHYFLVIGPNAISNGQTYRTTDLPKDGRIEGHCDCITFIKLIKNKTFNVKS